MRTIWTAPLRLALILLLSTTVPAVKGALCDPLAGINCWGNDLAQTGPFGTAAECCTSCSAHAECEAWTFNKNEGNPPGGCWLKTSCAGARADGNAVSGSSTPPSPPPPPPSPRPPPPDYINGVSIGGWLLTEPSWMYDQFSFPAEADLVASLRASGGDEYAIKTMRNHWAGYIPDAALDALQALGVTHCRIPVGYWIAEAPSVPMGAEGVPSMYTFGFNHEGFATGAMNYLEAALAGLKKRGIKALVDVHALPGGGSQCQSYAGWQVPYPLFWSHSPPADNTTAIPGCGGGGGGPYRTTRGSGKTWLQVGEEAILALGQWVVALEANASLSGTVVGLEVANEPGLQTGGLQPYIERLLLDTVPPLQAMFSAGGVATSVTVNFIGPNDVGAGQWLAQQVAAGTFNSSRLVVDFHKYYNWDGSESWQELAAKVCGTTFASADWAQYTQHGLLTVVGEWSCSTNLGAKAFTDLSSPAVVSRLKTLYANQMSLFSAPEAGSSGQHHWSLRMGSGWDPRPTPSAPQGQQAAGSAWDRSLPGFSFGVWSLGELIRVGVAQPLALLNVTGVCKCSGCSVNG